MNNASNSAKTGRWSCIFYGTANGGNAKPATIAASDAFFENMNFDDVVSSAIFTRLANRVHVTGCRFVRPVAANGQDNALVSILDGQGHVVTGNWADGGLAPGSYNNGSILTNGSAFIFSMSNPYEFYDPNPNTSRATHFRTKYTFTSMVNSFTISGADASTGFGFHWTDADAALQYNHAAMSWRFSHSAGSGAGWLPDDTYEAIATDLVAKTFTIQPQNKWGAQGWIGAANGPTVFIDGLRLSALQTNVIFSHNHMQNVRGAAMFAWYVNGLKAFANTGKNCLDIFMDLENCWNSAMFGNHYQRTAEVDWTGSAFSLLYAIEKCSCNDNTISVQAGARLEYGIDCAPKGNLHRHIKLNGNSANGVRLSASGGTAGATDYGFAVDVEMAHNDLSCNKGPGQDQIPVPIDLYRVQRARVLHNILGPVRDVPVVFKGCRGLEIAFNTIVGGGFYAGVASEDPNDSGLCDSLDVSVHDNDVMDFDGNAPGYVVHALAPSTAVQVVNNRTLSMGGTLGTAKPQQYQTSPALTLIPADGEARPRSASFTLSRNEHHGRAVPCTAALTVTTGTAATLGGGFRCNVHAVGVAVTIDGPGATNVSVASGEIATVYVVNNTIAVTKGAASVIS